MTAAFGFVAGLCIAAAGTNVVDEPLKAIGLICVLSAAHFLLRGSK